MATRIYNILYDTYIEYCEMLQFTYYSAIKSIYYFDKVTVYNIQRQILEKYSDKFTDSYLTLVEYDHKTEKWYSYMKSPDGIDNKKFMHCMTTWRAYVNKYFLFLTPLKSYDPYMGFRINRLNKSDVTTDEEKKEIMKFTKNKRNNSFLLSVLYTKRITKIKDINYKILTYLFHKRNFKAVYRTYECSRKANMKQIEGFYQ